MTPAPLIMRNHLTVLGIVTTLPLDLPIPHLVAKVTNGEVMPLIDMPTQIVPQALGGGARRRRRRLAALVVRIMIGYPPLEITHHQTIVGERLPKDMLMSELDTGNAISLCT